MDNEDFTVEELEIALKIVSSKGNSCLHSICDGHYRLKKSLEFDVVVAKAKDCKIQKKTIWVLDHYENSYEGTQGIICWWSEKPTYQQLFDKLLFLKALDEDQKDIYKTAVVISLLEGIEVRCHNTDYTLWVMEEG